MGTQKYPKADADMTLTEEFLTYESDRAVKYLHAKKMPHTVYGSVRCCKAVLDGDRWEPAPYTPDGKTPSENGVDVILFPIIQGGEVINIVAFDPNIKPLQLYLRQADCNVWALLDLIEGMQR